MKYASIVSALTLLLAGCVADPGGYVDTMKGVGAARVLPDGSSGFTFAISENAYDGIIPRGDTKAIKAQHDYIISSWVGSSGICKRGYTVAPPKTISGTVIYEGRCK